MDGDFLLRCNKYNIQVLYVLNRSVSGGVDLNQTELIPDNFVCRYAQRIPSGIKCSLSTKQCQYFQDIKVERRG